MCHHFCMGLIVKEANCSSSNLSLLTECIGMILSKCTEFVVLSIRYTRMIPLLKFTTGVSRELRHVTS